MRQFSDAHLAALAVLAVAVSLAVWAPRRHPGRWIVYVERAIALAILAAWAGEYVADVVLGTWSVQYTLPLQLTDAVSLCSIFALCTRRIAFVELSYFWSLTATLQAVITPDLGQNFPSVFYFTYFTYHIGAITGACLLVLGCGRYPRAGAVWRVWAATLAWACLAAVGDLVTGGNYMYLSEKPEHNSLLSVFGPWPWYILGGIGLAIALLLVVAALARGVRAVADPTLVVGNNRV